METKDKTYNGWTNYETWLLKLWIDNERNDQEYWKDRDLNWLAISQADNTFTKKERATLDLMDELKEQFQEENFPLDVGFYADLLSGALREINYYEVAQSIIEENEQ